MTTTPKQPPVRGKVDDHADMHMNWTELGPMRILGPGRDSNLQVTHVSWGFTLIYTHAARTTRPHRVPKVIAHALSRGVDNVTPTLKLHGQAMFSIYHLRRSFNSP